jgi:hypothetical protein
MHARPRLTSEMWWWAGATVCLQGCRMGGGPLAGGRVRRSWRTIRLIASVAVKKLKRL